MKPLYLQFVNTGIANRYEFEDHELIEMNDRIRKYPRLFYQILIHEIEHEEGGFKLKDLVHDMKAKTPGLFYFMRKHISAWTQILPCWWDFKRKQIVYDISVIVSWVVIIGLAFFMYKFLGWIL